MTVLTSSLSPLTRLGANATLRLVQEFSSVGFARKSFHNGTVDENVAKSTWCSPQNTNLTHRHCLILWLKSWTLTKVVDHLQKHFGRFPWSVDVANWECPKRTDKVSGTQDVPTRGRFDLETKSSTLKVS